ncbi:MAG TPA: cyclase family protein [Solirubrobacteraceae bacterium]|nr:cyclase family protein [Solirubrobacteraceae bacterium]
MPSAPHKVLAAEDVTAKQFTALFDDLKRWGRWGQHDERGALNMLTPARVAAAARLVRDGLTVTLSLPVNTHAAAHNPKPADHHMTALGSEASNADPVHFLKDYVGLDYHNDGHTHIDALCHVAYEGSLYNGRSERTVTEQGAPVNSIETLKDGLVGRGVLLDIPRARGVPWLEPGEHVFRSDLEAAELIQEVVVQEGDILLIRTGHARRLAELGPWNTAEAKAGLHPRAMSLLAERGVAALGSDGNNDTAPSSTEGVEFPIHVLAIAAMGIHLLDYLQFEDLRAACESGRRWEFLFVAAPLFIVGGTGSPANPIAIF